MRIVVNHLTRMQRGYVCVAGIDPQSNEHIRPVIQGRLPAAVLAIHGGPFSMAAVVNLGKVANYGSPPDVEDRLFVQRAAQQEGTIKDREFWQLLEQTSAQSLRDIFGAELVKKYSGSAVVRPGTGQASLGCLRSFQFRSLYLNEDTDHNGNTQKKIRFSLVDPDLGGLDLSVTDIRLYGDDHVTPDEDVVSDVENRINSGIDVILSVGLTRAFPASDPVHWLQVNNIHLEDDPTWDL